MSCKKLEFKKPAIKFLENCTRKEAIKLIDKINCLPDGKHIKKMEGYSNRYRLRVGNVRIIYELRAETHINCTSEKPPNIVLTVLVLDIGYRGDVYK